jgi:outer membrane protein OmpA-like peptidoglycan-associated protein
MGLRRSAATSGKLRSVFCSYSQSRGAIDKAKLTPRARAAVQAAAAALPGQAKRHLGIYGHTDDTGTAARNLDRRRPGLRRDPADRREREGRVAVPRGGARNRRVEIAVLS